MFTPLRDYHLHQDEYQQKINQVLNHGRFINGSEISELEHDLANYVKVKHCIAVSSGTDALMVALMALDVKPGDEVITVAHTWISTAEVIGVLGAKPVFVDIDPQTFLMDLSLVKEKVTDHTVGIIYVSLYGQMGCPEETCQLAKDLGLWLIEDGAQSFGCQDRNGVISCSWGDVGCTSFFPSKPLGCYGDSGACFTNSDQLAEKIRAIKSHGGLVRFEHQYLGLNARMDTIQAAILQVKLKYFIEYGLERRREIANYYSRELSEINGLQVPKVIEGMKPAWAQYSMIVSREDLNRDRLVKQLAEHDIHVSVFYPKGLHQQPCFGQVGKVQLPQTEYVCNRVLNLPLFPELTQDELERIVEVVKKICS